MSLAGLTLGVPKEIMEGERRVSATPDTVKKMVAQGAKVIVERNAGEGSFLHDDAYAAAGATLTADVARLYADADVILKVKEPKLNHALGKHEVDMMHRGQFLISFLHPASPPNRGMVQMLADNGVVAFTLDGIPRISRAQFMDALTSMSTVAGYKAVLIAADRLPRFFPMVGTAVGAIQPANTLVVGVGVAGLQAVATGKRLGSVVRAADIRPDACEQAKSLGAQVVPTGVPPELAVGEGGYANRLPEEWLVKERKALRDAVAQADVAILAALIPGKVAPILVTEEMVKAMKPGSVIVDIAIDQGGNCDITEAGKVVDKCGVTIEGIQNLPGMVPSTSTWMFAQNIFNYLVNLVRDGKLAVNEEDEIVRSSLVTLNGRIVHAGTLEAMKAL